jgi:hypothetical protein
MLAGSSELMKHFSTNAAAAAERLRVAIPKRCPFERGKALAFLLLTLLLSAVPARAQRLFQRYIGTGAGGYETASQMIALRGEVIRAYASLFRA